MFDAGLSAAEFVERPCVAGLLNSFDNIDHLSRIS